MTDHLIALKLIVEKSMDAAPVLDSGRSKTRRLVIYFKIGTTAEEKLQHIQVQTGRPVMNLDTRRNSSYEIIERFHEQREAVAAFHWRQCWIQDSKAL